MRRNDLTLMRALACLLIVNYHLQMLNLPYWTIFTKGNFILNTTFMGLSGYSLMLSSQGRKERWPDWARRRLLRIYPPFWLSIIIILLVYISFGLLSPTNPLCLLAYATGLHYYFGCSSLGLHLWFITVLLVCYAFFLPGKKILEKSELTFLILALLLFVIAVAIIWQPGGGFSWAGLNAGGDVYQRIWREHHLRSAYYLLIFFLSMLLAAREQRRGKSGLPVGVKALAAAGSCCAYMFLLKVMGSTLILNLVGIICGISSVYWFYQAADAASTRLSWAWPVIEFVAGISYEIYLLHYMTIVFARSCLPLWAAPGCIVLGTIGLAYGVNKVSSWISRRLSAVSSGTGPGRSRA